MSDKPESELRDELTLRATPKARAGFALVDALHDWRSGGGSTISVLLALDEFLDAREAKR